MKLLLRKEKYIYKLNNGMKEISEENFKKIIPNDAQNIEIVFNSKNSILKIDYVTFKEEI